MKNQKHKSPIICRCNNVNRGTIEAAIRDGCDTMNKIFDATTAGVGPCGGSCRRKLLPMLEHYLKTGTFPEKIVEDTTGKVGATPASSSAAPPSSESASNANSSDAAAPAETANGTASVAKDALVVEEEIKKRNSSDENR